MAEYRLGPAAQRDLDRIFDHSVALWGLSRTLDYIDLLQTAFADLAEGPLRSQDCADIRLGYRRRGVGRHVVYFKATDYGIAVVRILHQRMDAGRHL